MSLLVCFKEIEIFFERYGISNILQLALQGSLVSVAINDIEKIIAISKAEQSFWRPCYPFEWSRP